MTLRLWLPLFLFSASALFAAPAEDIEFSAVLVLPGKTSVRLALRSGGSAAWIPVGQSFEGYVISVYDAKGETVVLTEGGVTTRVHLNTAKIQEGKPPLDPAVVAQQKKAIMNNLRQIGAAADQYYLEHGTNHATIADLVGEGKYIRELKSVDGEDYGQLTLTQGNMSFSVTTAGGVTVAYQP